MYQLELWGFRNKEGTLKYGKVWIIETNLTYGVASYNKELFEEENILNGDEVKICWMP